MSRIEQQLDYMITGSGELPVPQSRIEEQIAYIIEHGVGGVVIQADNNTQIGSDVVPVLTAEQITTAYNAVVAGKTCVITDALGMIHLNVFQAVSTDEDVEIYVLYFDRLILCYKEDGQIIPTYIQSDEVS